MCGIAGYVGFGNKDILEKMTDVIKYRGPDNEGFFVSNDVGLGMRRLSIIDLSSGDQPIYNEDKSIVIVFNGEIYNFQDLKKELIAKGHRFYTKSDTEVVVHQYEERGENCFKDLNGMFAVAIWDIKKRRLILARDRYGEKPLYWSLKDKTLIFASELKSVLVHPLIKRDLNHLAIYQYFSFDYVPQPFTIFKDIYKLENGSFLVFNENEVNLEKFYKIENTETKIDFNIALNNLEELMEDSVKIRLIADVPVGIFLSGGIDSSTIAYFAKKQKKDIETFSIGFSEKTFDESKYANQVADLLKTDHYHREFKPNDLLDAIPEIIEKLDEPFGDPSILPTYLLSKFAREKVKAALGGDGGDELLMGYPNHRVQKILYTLGVNNLSFTKINFAEIVERFLSVSDKNLTLFYKIKRYAHSIAFPALYRDFLNIGGYLGKINNLFRFNIELEQPFNFADKFLADYNKCNYLEKINLLFLKYYLEDDILFKADRASMYNSLEVRAPFLDFRLVDFINSLPLEYKLHGLTTKYILKKMVKDKLPQNIVYRKKKGFGVPLTAWLKNDLKDYTAKILNQKEIDKFGLIDYSFVKNIIEEHVNNKKDNRKIIWNLIIFQNWCKNYLK